MMRSGFVQLLLLSVTAALMGCASGGVGPKIGMEIPVSGANVEGSVTSSSSSPGFVGGLTFEGLFNRTWGFRSDLQIRTMSTTADFTGASAIADGSYSVHGTMRTLGTFVDVPVMVTFSPTDSTASLQPFFGVGGRASFNTTVNASVGGTQTFTNSEGSTSGALSQQISRSGISAPDIGVVFSGGVRWNLSPMWEARVEGRLNQVVISDDIASYTVYTTSYREVASVGVSAPTTTFAISAGVMLRL